MAHNLIAIGMPGGMEMIVIGVIALLIFGRRLPDVARSVGKSIVEFKKGLREINDEVDSAGDDSSKRILPRQELKTAGIHAPAPERTDPQSPGSGTVS